MTSQHSIELLVTTATGIHAVTLNQISLELEDHRILHTGKGYYFGITYDANFFYILARNYNPGVPGAKQANEILIFDKNLKEQGAISCSKTVVEGHQIYCHQGTLYICNTNRNCITALNIQQENFNNIYPIPAYQDENYHHINSILIEGDRVSLVAANRFRSSFVMDFCLPDFRLLGLDALGLSAHNIVPTPYGRLLCDSFHAALHCWKLGMDEAKNEYPLHTIHIFPDVPDIRVQRINMQHSFLREQRGVPVFLRGLAVAADLVIIGLSEMGKRLNRHASCSRLFVLDGLSQAVHEGWARQSATLTLGDYGAVMDVRVINQPDLGHPLPPGVHSPRMIAPQT